MALLYGKNQIYKGTIETYVFTRFSAKNLGWRLEAPSSIYTFIHIPDKTLFGPHVH